MSTSNFPIIESIMKLPVGGGSLKQYGGLYTPPSGGQVVVADYHCCEQGDEEGSAFAYLWGIAGPADSSEAAANALLDVLRRKSMNLPVNSFQSILLARIAEHALPALSTQSFWNFAAMWPTLHDRGDDTIAIGARIA